ncbi:MAG: hypothetical protein J5654_02270 [Victivallales bacterium]|nr:hypothetical protein [Victivallales bacterium]
MLIFGASCPALTEPVAIVNGDFEGMGGWQNANGNAPEYIDDAHGGAHALRLENTLVKSQFISLAPGESLFFEAYVKADMDKRIVTELAFFDANHNWLKRGSGPLAYGTAVAWQKISGQFENGDSEVRYVTLEFYGSGAVDDVSALKRTPLVASVPDEAPEPEYLNGLPVFTRREPPRPLVEIPLQNGDLEGQGGWVDAPGNPPELTEDAHSGARACRLNGGMVKTNLITLAPGEEFHFEAYTKVDNINTILAELAFFDAQRNWLRRGTGQLARGDQYSWQKISGRYENTDPAVRYVTLQFYGAGELDDVTAHRLAAPPPTNDRTFAKQEFLLPEETTDDFLYLVNDDFKLWISRSTGLMVRLVSRRPTEKVIQPTGANSMQLYMKSLDGKYFGDFNQVVGWKQPESDEVRVRLACDNPQVAALAEAEICYSLKINDLQVKTKILYKTDSFQAWQLGLRSVFRADEWRDSIFFSFPASVRPPDATVRAQFFYAPDDLGVKNMNTFYPCAVTEDDERYLLWGSYDLGALSLLTPNDIAWRLPAMQRTPAMLKAGESAVFECNYAVFPKADHELTQVMRHYIDHVYSSNPLMASHLKRPDQSGRHFTEGAFAWYHPQGVPVGYDGWREAMLERNANNVWYSWWANWNEEALTEGDWYTYDTRHLSADGLKEEIAYMKSKGLNVYLYFRQFLAENGTYEDHAPYKIWLGRDAEGRRQPFIDFPVPHPELLGGQEKVLWTCADFGNPQYRKWYIEMVKRAVDFYQPSGIAWDMGFGSAYSRADPWGGLGNGTLLVQAEIWKWLKTSHPEMRVVSNECFFSPTALFADALLIEGAWDVAHKGPIDYQAAKAFDATIFSLQLVDDYVIQGAPETDLRPYTHFELRVRGEHLRQLYLGSEAVAAGFVPDGTWQTVRVPVKNDGFRVFGVGMRTDEAGDAWVEVESVKLVNAQDSSKSKMVLDATALSPLDFIIYEKWSSYPTEGHCTKNGKVLRFTARQPNGNASWHCIAPIRDKLLAINLRVTALGAICSDMQLPELHELNEFAAKLAAMRHLSEKKLIYDAPQGVFGTFWQRDDAVSGAIYNESGASCEMPLRLKRTAFPDGGAALEQALAAAKVRLRLASNDGSVTDAAVTLTPRAEDFLLEGELPTGQLLLLETQCP